MKASEVRPADAEIAALLRELAESAEALHLETFGPPLSSEVTLAARARAAADQLEKSRHCVFNDVQDDASRQRIRSTTPCYRLSVIIRTNDTCIDNRIIIPIASVLDAKQEILESISLPTLLPQHAKSGTIP